MHSGHIVSPEEFRPFPGYASHNPHQELAFPPASRPSRLSSFCPRAGWNLEGPSDADLDDEEILPAALSRAEERQNTSLHSTHLHSSPIPIPMPASNTIPQINSASPAAMFLSAFSPSFAAAPLPDDEGQVVAGYTLGGVIGYGGSSIIRRAFSASGGIVAVKIVKRSEIQKQHNPLLARKRLQHEAEVWSSLSHEHILPLFSTAHTSYADFFVTLFCPAGSLYDILKRDDTQALPQDDVGMMFRQVVRGLRYLHEVVMYVHRDIKLENVLVDEMGVCRIGDFGMSRKIGEIDEDDLESDVEDQYEHDPFHQAGNLAVHRAATIAGPSARRHARSSLQPATSIARHGGGRHRNSTSSAHPVHACQPGSLPYAAPEILLPQTTGPLRPHPAQDIWALGVMLYALLTSRFPFSDSFEPRLQMKILQGTFDLPCGIGKGAERVLKGCLEQSTQQRWTVSMVDEVAWEVGWGGGGDDATPAESDEEYQTHCKSSPRPTSRSRSRPPAIAIPSPSDDSTMQEESRSRPALEAASRRSASRAKRSLSRAPVPTHHQPYSGRSGSGRSLSRGVMSRHNSRAPSPTPASSGLGGGIMSNVESPFLSSPTSSVDRGRRLSRREPLIIASRSPSPSVVPGTPIDFGAPFSLSFSASLPVVNDQPDELHLDGVGMDEEEERRGRSKSTREIRASSLSFTASGDSDSDNINGDVGHWGGGLGGAKGTTAVQGRQDDNHSPVRLGASDKERSRSCGFSLRASSPSSTWLPSTRHSHHHYQHHHHHHAYEPYEYDHEFWMKRRNKRTGSSPPTPVTPGATPWNALSRPSAYPSQTDQLLPITAATINEYLKKSVTAPASSDHLDLVGMPTTLRRGRSVGRGIGWS